MVRKEQLLFAANIIINILFFKQKLNSPIRSILVVKLDEIGDMAACTHVFKLLKNQFPNAPIELLCKPFVKSLVENDPNIDHIITDEIKYNKSYSLVVELRGTWKTLFKSVLYKGKYRLSRAEVRMANKGRQLHEIDTNYEIIKPIINSDKANFITHQLYFSQNDIKTVESFLKDNKISKFAIIHAGARRKLRQWPAERFAFVANYLFEKYKLEIIFSGSQEDNETYENIEKYIKFKPHYFTNGFSLAMFSYLCSKASFYIGNESGPLQIASVFKMPLIALYGPGVPNVFYPRAQNSIVLHHVLKCNPCNQIDCVQPEMPCINLILENDVIMAIDKFLN